MSHSQGHAITNGVFRPFAIVKKSDGRPAVEVNNDGKKRQFVSVPNESEVQFVNFFYSPWKSCHRWSWRKCARRQNST
jgi:hypothetical protein